jgi:hypothetical protein
MFTATYYMIEIQEQYFQDLCNTQLQAWQILPHSIQKRIISLMGNALFHKTQNWEHNL